MSQDTPRPDAAAPVLPYSGPVGPGGGLQCPRCGGPAKPVKFTWWGGLLGPKMFNHTKCQSCRFGFNAKTGRSNDKVIAIYACIAVAVSIAVGLAYAFA
jgi:transposase-like protein